MYLGGALPRSLTTIGASAGGGMTCVFSLLVSNTWVGREVGEGRGICDGSIPLVGEDSPCCMGGPCPCCCMVLPKPGAWAPYWYPPPPPGPRVGICCIDGGYCGCCCCCCWLGGGGGPTPIPQGLGFIPVNPPGAGANDGGGGGRIPPPPGAPAFVGLGDDTWRVKGGGLGGGTLWLVFVLPEVGGKVPCWCASPSSPWYCDCCCSWFGKAVLMTDGLIGV